MYQDDITKVDSGYDIASPQTNKTNQKIVAGVAGGAVAGIALLGGALYANNINNNPSNDKQNQGEGFEKFIERMNTDEKTSTTHQTPIMPHHETAEAGGGGNKPEILGKSFDMNTAPHAHNVDDSMSFNEAFATARAETGAGGLFEWRGGIYGTFYATEVDKNGNPFINYDKVNPHDPSVGGGGCCWNAKNTNLYVNAEGLKEPNLQPRIETASAMPNEEIAGGGGYDTGIELEEPHIDAKGEIIEIAEHESPTSEATEVYEEQPTIGETIEVQNDDPITPPMNNDVINPDIIVVENDSHNTPADGNDYPIAPQDIEVIDVNPSCPNAQMESVERLVQDNSMDYQNNNFDQNYDQNQVQDCNNQSYEQFEQYDITQQHATGSIGDFTYDPYCS